jgi:hypothetical protein
MVTADRRQLWINGTRKWCDHPNLDEIKSEGGTTLAEVCRACGLRIAEYGKCNGCGRDRRLVKFVASRRTRYCSEDCLSAFQARARAEKEAKAKADAAAILKGFPK